MLKNSVVIILSLGLTGCATSFKAQLLQTMAATAAIGAVYGLSKPENKTPNAVMWGALGATSGALITVLTHDPDKEAERQRREAERLREELSLLNSPKLEKQTSGLFGSKVPEKYRHLINPGEWNVSRIDQWIEEDENRLVHQDLVMELTPPTLKPISKPTNKKDK